jgi:hypothetical protein
VPKNPGEQIPASERNPEQNSKFAVGIAGWLVPAVGPGMPQAI